MTTKNKFLCKAKDFQALPKLGITFPDSLGLVSTDPDVPLRRLKLAMYGRDSFWLDSYETKILWEFITTDPEGEIFLLTYEED